MSAILASFVLMGRVEAMPPRLCNRNKHAACARRAVLDGTRTIQYPKPLWRYSPVVALKALPRIGTGGSAMAFRCHCLAKLAFNILLFLLTLPCFILAKIALCIYCGKTPPSRSCLRRLIVRMTSFQWRLVMCLACWIRVRKQGFAWVCPGGLLLRTNTQHTAGDNLHVT